MTSNAILGCLCLLFTTNAVAHASLGPDECQQMLTSDGRRESAASSPRSGPPSAAFRPIAPGTLQPDRIVPDSAVETIEARIKRGGNVSPDVAAFAGTTEHLSVEQASAARGRILAAIAAAAERVSRGDLAGATEILSAKDLLNDSGFVRRTGPGFPYAEMAAVARNELEYVRFLRGQRGYRPCVSTKGTVCIPPRGWASGLGRNADWIQRHWIRTAGEELGHVAQILGEHIDPSGGFLSRMLGDERRAYVRGVVSQDGEVINERRGRSKSRKAWWRIHHLAEADIYAFLIEPFGPEFIPVWYGEDSGYVVRRHVDEEFERLGLNGRAWKDSR